MGSKHFRPTLYGVFNNQKHSYNTIKPVYWYLEATMNTNPTIKKKNINAI